MWQALAWGALAASSLLLGTLLGLVRAWPRRLVGLVLGFGAGALIAAVAFELALEGVRVGGPAAAATGLAAGALTYYLLDGVIGRVGAHRPAARLTGSRRPAARRAAAPEGGPVDPGRALALGAVLDGVPEQLVLGIGIATGPGLSTGLLVAVFVSNLPESAGSATEMRTAGHSGAAIWRLWLAVAVVSTVAAVAGYAVADLTTGSITGAINGFAAGATLVMLIDSMIPAAAAEAGRPAGLASVLGFAIAAGFSTLSL